MLQKTYDHIWLLARKVKISLLYDKRNLTLDGSFHKFHMK